jgi:hypothetical protein
MDHWQQEIFAYFTVLGTSATNATTEALNGIAKLANRCSISLAFLCMRSDTIYTGAVFFWTVALRSWNAPTVQARAPLNRVVGSCGSNLMTNAKRALSLPSHDGSSAKRSGKWLAGNALFPLERDPYNDIAPALASVPAICIPSWQTRQSQPSLYWDGGFAA